MSTNYAAFVEALASKAYHTDIIDARQVMGVLSALIALGPVIDDTKRGLFYGKRKLKDQVEAEAFMLNFLPDLPAVRHVPKQYADLFHGLLGMASEIAEIIEVLIPQINPHGNVGDIDTANLIEELGDFRFYYQLALNAIGSNDQHVVGVNVKKLEKRYPEGTFSQDRAVNRDTNAERAILEAGAEIELKGSDVLPSHFAIEGQPFRHEHLVARAFGKSGLTREAWNSLSVEYRDVLLCRELSNWRMVIFTEKVQAEASSTHQ